MKRILIVAAAAAALAGCAKRPDAIAPVAISDTAYSGFDCAALSTMLATERQTLVALSAQQNQAATGDAVGVFLIGVPASSLFGGDKEGQIAVSKGTVLAMETAQLRNGCLSGQSAEPPASASAGTSPPPAPAKKPVN